MGCKAPEANGVSQVCTHLCHRGRADVCSGWVPSPVPNKHHAHLSQVKCDHFPKGAKSIAKLHIVKELGQALLFSLLINFCHLVVDGGAELWRVSLTKLLH